MSETINRIVLVPEQQLKDVANAIRERGGVDEEYYVSDMPSAIRGAINAELMETTITPTTMEQIVKPEEGCDGFSKVTVEAVKLEVKTINSSTSTQTITPSGNNLGLSRITVNPYTVQAKTVTPSEFSQSIVADAANALSQVTVEAIPKNYKDITGITVTAEDVLSGKTFVTADGVTSGTMPISTISKVINTNETYTIPRGYHNGTGKITANSTSVSDSGTFATDSSGTATLLLSFEPDFLFIQTGSDSTSNYQAGISFKDKTKAFVSATAWNPSRNDFTQFSAGLSNQTVSFGVYNGNDTALANTTFSYVAYKFD